MSFEEQLSSFILKIPELKNKLSTEESTKNSLIMPMLNMLGYNVFDPNEVNPEYNADFGTKNKEKVDYAVMKDDQPIMLIECKPCTMKLGNKQTSQLYRYFSVCPAKIGILTNGLEYQFYSDLEAENKMDSKPFLIVDLENLKEDNITQLAKFQKDQFDVGNIITQGQKLKETSGLIKVIKEEMEQPSDELVRFYAKKVYDGVINQKVLEHYRPMVKSAFLQIVAEKLNVKVQALQSSINDDIIEEEKETDETKPGIETTDEEITGFAIVRAIGAKICTIDHITIRDAISYCAVLFDDNNRKPIVRMHFNSPTVKYLSTFDKDGKETKNKIESVYDMYQYQEQILEAIQRFL